jgi:hypothetical protein
MIHIWQDVPLHLFWSSAVFKAAFRQFIIQLCSSHSLLSSLNSYSCICFQGGGGYIYSGASHGYFRLTANCTDSPEKLYKFFYLHTLNTFIDTSKDNKITLLVPNLDTLS